MASKLKKYPKAPKLGKKPKASATLQSKQNFLEREKAKEKIYLEKCKAVDKANATIAADAKKSEKLTKEISGVKRVTPKRK